AARLARGFSLRRALGRAQRFDGAGFAHGSCGTPTNSLYAAEAVRKCRAALRAAATDVACEVVAALGAVAGPRAAAVEMPEQSGWDGHGEEGDPHRQENVT